MIAGPALAGAALPREVPFSAPVGRGIVVDARSITLTFSRGDVWTYIGPWFPGGIRFSKASFLPGLKWGTRRLGGGMVPGRRIAASGERKVDERVSGMGFGRPAGQARWGLKWSGFVV